MMGAKSVGILVTTYNDDPAMLNSCLQSVYRQDYPNLFIVCVDDGSDVPVQDALFVHREERMQCLRIPHGERAAARKPGVHLLRERQVDYLLFLDSDMQLPEHFITRLVEFADDGDYDGIVIPELAYSNDHSFWTQVKVFERNLYQAGCKVGSTSIEAARWWQMGRFPGFEDGLNAFEEIQPTLSCLRNGGRIGKIRNVSILHDEKQISLKKLIQKKSYYFTEMSSHQAVTWRDMFGRFYFFRAQLYHPENLKKYVLHPFLFSGVLILYTIMTMIAGRKLIYRFRER